MSNEIPQDTLRCLIAAAVHSVIDEPFRIVSIEPETRVNTLWTIHGRIQQFDGHRLR
ncbi:MAG: hypothetical protein H6686_12450 [Fibrobacteria bacterium]|nr:hypothetical protein [Fibrobacteria bacterium]